MLNALTPENIVIMSMTPDTSHCEMSSLNIFAPENIALTRTRGYASTNSNCKSADRTGLKKSFTPGVDFFNLKFLFDCRHMETVVTRDEMRSSHGTNVDDHTGRINEMCVVSCRSCLT